MFFIKQELPINGGIRAKEVQLIGDNGEKLGVLSIKDALNLKDKVVLVTGGTGYIGSHIEDRKLYIDDLYLFPPFQNKGIGTYLIRQLIEQTNLDVVLHVFRNNTGAFALYRRLGFEIEAEYDRSRYLMIYRQIPEDDDFGE